MTNKIEIDNQILVHLMVKKEIVRFSQKLYQKGFVANHDGNISVKRGTAIWATPSSQSKGDITEDMLVFLDENGKKISGAQAVFSEINLHLACYRIRKDIQAVIHAHPPVATAFACAAIELKKIFIAEAIVTLGESIPLVPFIPPGCPDTEKILQPCLFDANVLLLQNHGVIAVGKDLAQAYYRLELAEHLANIEWHSRWVGDIKPLPQKVVQELLEKRKKMGLSPNHSQPSLAWHSPENVVDNPAFKKILKEELGRLLKVPPSP